VPHKDSTSGAYTIPENRQLNAEERTLIEWLIANGIPEAKITHHNLKAYTWFRIVAAGVHGGFGRCERSSEHHGTGRLFLLTFWLLRPRANKSGFMLHARQGKISELEVYPMDTIVGSSFPKIETLNPFNRPKDWA